MRCEWRAQGGNGDYKWAVPVDQQAVDLFQLISAILFLCRNWLKYPLELYIVYSGGDPRERA